MSMFALPSTSVTPQLRLAVARYTLKIGTEQVPSLQVTSPMNDRPAECCGGGAGRCKYCNSIERLNMGGGAASKYCNDIGTIYAI